VEAYQPAAAFDYFLTVPYYQFATVERMITDVLDLDDTRYEPPTGRQGIGRTGLCSAATGRFAGAGTPSNSPAKACRRWTPSSSRPGGTGAVAGSS